jgi:hypothetical protein
MRVSRDTIKDKDRQGRDRVRRGPQREIWKVGAGSVSGVIMGQCGDVPRTGCRVKQSRRVVHRVKTARPGLIVTRLWTCLTGKGGTFDSYPLR